MQTAAAIDITEKRAADSALSIDDLYNVALDLLRSSGGDPGRVTAAFVSKVIAFNLLYPLARAYLNERAAELKGDVADRAILATQSSDVDPSPHQRDGRGHERIDTLGGGAAPSHSNRGERGHPQGVTQSASAPPVREPSPLQREAAASMRLKMANTVLDAFKVRDGRSIGDIFWRELDALHAENAIEASILRQVRQSVANADPNARVRDVVKVSDLEKMIAKAKADTRVAA